ncbi:MAG: ParB/RepB/Spo0J family partition protein [Bradymonadaceae bacterium]
MSDGDSKKQRRGLGRGLGNLIRNRDEGETGELVRVPVEDVERPGDQPRREFDEEGLVELAESIEENGVIQPLVVREAGDAYELIAGERRLRASRRAGLEDVPAVVRDVDDAQAYALALVENVQREDLNPVEEAEAYGRLLEEFDFTQGELAERLGKSRSTIANATRLLKLPGSVRELLESEAISRGHARALVGLADEAAEELAERIVDEGLNVRQTETIAKRLRGKGEGDTGEEESEETTSTPGGSRYRNDAQTRRIAEELQRTLGTKVELKDEHGEGKVEIHYDDYEVLNAVLEKLGVDGS